MKNYPSEYSRGDYEGTLIVEQSELESLKSEIKNLRREGIRCKYVKIPEIKGPFGREVTYLLMVHYQDEEKLTTTQYERMSKISAHCI